MAELGLTEDKVKEMIQASDMALSLGLYEFEEGEQAVSVDGKLKTVEELKEMLIPVTPSQANPSPFVKLGDIATIEKVGKVESVSRTNGEDAIAIQIVKGQEANTVTVVNAVKELIEEEKEAIDGLIVDVTLDQGKPIEDSIFSMVEKAVIWRFNRCFHYSFIPARCKINDYFDHIHPCFDFKRITAVKLAGYYIKYYDIRCDYDCDWPCY